MRKLRLEELNRISVDEFKEMPKRKIVVVLDNIRSGLNVGSIFRTADAFAIQHLYLCGITGRPPHREILKSAIGATESVSWSGYEYTQECLSHLLAKGWRLIGVEQTSSSIMLQELSLTKDHPVALVFGNEVDGLSSEAMTFLQETIEIPQWGTKHSLNVSVCAGIVLWHLVQLVDLATD